MTLQAAAGAAGRLILSRVWRLTLAAGWGHLLTGLAQASSKHGNLEGDSEVMGPRERHPGSYILALEAETEKKGTGEPLITYRAKLGPN